ncbi:hypothetical protein CL689_03005 [Candidatus Saccharibacteria bacterium]|nr:hypothetical protein [Candidatus Saccharibacteria bacterium]
MTQLQGHLRWRDNKLLHIVSLLYTTAWLKIALLNMRVEKTVAQTLVSFDLWFLLIPPAIFYALALLQEITRRIKPLRLTRIAYLMVAIPIATLNVILAITTRGSMGEGALIYAVPMLMTILAAPVLPVMGIFEIVNQKNSPA